MVLGKMASEVIDQCILEINKNENIEKVKDKLVKPCIAHIYNYLHNYILLFYVTFGFLCLSIIILILVMIIILNKVNRLDIKVV